MGGGRLAETMTLEGFGKGSGVLRGRKKEEGIENLPGWERVGVEDVALERGEGGGELEEALAGLLEGFDVVGAEGGGHGWREIFGFGGWIREYGLIVKSVRSR